MALSLDSWVHHVSKPTPASGMTRRGVNSNSVSDLVLSVHGLTAATRFGLFVSEGKPIKVAEIELAEGAKELRYLLIRMQDVLISSVTPLPQGQQVGIAYGKIYWIYTPVASQPIPTEVFEYFPGIVSTQKEKGTRGRIDDDKRIVPEYVARNEVLGRALRSVANDHLNVAFAILGRVRLRRLAPAAI